MSNDGGIQYWQQAGVQEEYEAWLDSIAPGIEQAVEEFERAMPLPVKAADEKESGNVEFDCK